MFHTWNLCCIKFHKSFSFLPFTLLYIRINQWTRVKQIYWLSEVIADFHVLTQRGEQFKQHHNQHLSALACLVLTRTTQGMKKEKNWSANIICIDNPKIFWLNIYPFVWKSSFFWCASSSIWPAIWHLAHRFFTPCHYVAAVLKHALTNLSGRPLVSCWPPLILKYRSYLSCLWGFLRNGLKVELPPAVWRLVPAEFLPDSNSLNSRVSFSCCLSSFAMYSNTDFLGAGIGVFPQNLPSFCNRQGILFLCLSWLNILLFLRALGSTVDRSVVLGDHRGWEVLPSCNRLCSNCKNWQQSTWKKTIHPTIESVRYIWTKYFHRYFQHISPLINACASVTIESDLPRHRGRARTCQRIPIRDRVRYLGYDLGCSLSCFKFGDGAFWVPCRNNPWLHSCRCTLRITHH